MVNVAALVVNYGTPADLLVCVQSSSVFEKLRWAVFDNAHPTVDSSRYVDGLDEVELAMYSDVNRGHGYGINRLAEATREWNPDYFFIVNPDCRWTQPIIEEMVEFLEGDPVRVLVGPKQLDRSGKITAAGIFGTNEKPQHRLWHHQDPRDLQAKDVREAIVVAGSAMLIRVADFFEYGGLLEARHYYSETWLAYHLRAHGRTIWYYGLATMIHNWHQSTPVGSLLTDGQFKNDRELFRKMCDEHNPPIPRD